MHIGGAFLLELSILSSISVDILNYTEISTGHPLLKHRTYEGIVSIID